jgi:hypothetical protein
MRSIHKTRKCEDAVRVRHLPPRNTSNASTAEAHDAARAAPGVDAERQVVHSDGRGVRIALRPDVPSERDPNLKVHVVFLVDATHSMRGMCQGNTGEAAVHSILDNLAIGVGTHLSSMDEEQRKLVQETTDFAFASFGKYPRWVVGAESEEDQFVSVGDLGAHCLHVKSLLEFSDDRTDIASALLFATEALRSRMAASSVGQEATGTRHVGAIVLLTDGIQNAGDIGTAALVRSRMDQILSDMPTCSRHPAVYGLGLGESTDATYMSGLVSGRGHWTHVPDQTNALVSFTKILRTLLDVRGTFDVRLSAARRCAKNEDEDDDTTAVKEQVFSFGLLTGERQLGKLTTAFFPEAGDRSRSHFYYEIKAEIDGGKQTYLTEVDTIDKKNGTKRHKPFIGSPGLYEETKKVTEIMKQLEQHLGMATSREEGERVWQTFLSAHSKNSLACEAMRGIQTIARETRCFSYVHQMHPMMASFMGPRVNHATQSLFSRM